VGTDVTIKVSGLSKRFRIGALQERQKTLAETLSDSFAMPFRNLRALAQRGRLDRTRHDYIWALKDVTFEVERGEVVGVIGRNGAGKSTLLKILTRITTPTEGRAYIRGRVGSLLEVGTGFHPELTGRENTYLNGAILGMKREEIDQKFDEIVAFSGVEKFIDTPVKHFSSGMYLRLAFSVAAHLEPDILLVDEVLAVGDAEFQKKCLGKMSEVAGEGRTVLYVSHNLESVRRLCDSAIWLESGHIRTYNRVSTVVDSYLATVGQEVTEGSVFPIMNHEYGIGFSSCQTVLEPNPDTGALDLKLVLEVTAEDAMRRIGFGMSLTSETGNLVALLNSKLTGYVFDMQAGVNRFEAKIPNISTALTAGDYVIGLMLSMPRAAQLLRVEHAALIHIPDVDLYGTGVYPRVRKHGPVLLPLHMHEVKQLEVSQLGE
jgi:lipopolysaccharide transport system ATP-binding protein